jgi:hypothetical protein
MYKPRILLLLLQADSDDTTSHWSEEKRSLIEAINIKKVF